MKRLLLLAVLFMNIISVSAQITWVPSVGMNVSSYSNIEKENSFSGYFWG